MALEQGDGSENEILRDAFFEIASEFEEPITIRRFLSQSTAPTESGQAPQPIFQNYSAMATLVSLGTTSSLVEAGILSAGDVTLQMRDKLREANENIGGTHPGDRVIFRGMEFRLVMRQEPVYVAGDTFWTTFLRRINPTSDVAGK